MQIPPNETFSVVERRIQTLTSILQHMQSRHLPTTTRSLRPSFLHHMATLLTCGDPDAKRVIDVTGLGYDELRTLVVTQNPFGTTNVLEFGVKEIEKSSRAVEQVVENKSVDIPPSL